MDTLLIKRYNNHLINKFVSAFLDDYLCGAEGFNTTTLFVICVIDLFYHLGIFF